MGQNGDCGGADDWASLNNRIRKMEDLGSLGLGQFLDTFREALSRHK